MILKAEYSKKKAQIGKYKEQLQVVKLARKILFQILKITTKRRKSGGKIILLLIWIINSKAAEDQLFPKNKTS